MQSGSPAYTTISQETLLTSKDPSVVVTRLPVDKPINVPLEPLFYNDAVKTSVDYKIDDFEGQKSRSKKYSLSLVQRRVWREEEH